MKFKILIPFLLFIVVAACSKDKFNTRPQLKIKSVSDNQISRGEILKITLEVTDAEGDVSDSAFIQKIIPRCTAGNLIDRRTIPNFPAKKDFKGDIVITYGYNVQNVPQLPQPQCNRNDTCTFRIWVKDLAGNVSDTAETGQIIILR